MNDEKTVSITLTEKELSHIENDIIAYIWELEGRGCDKDDTYGYFSRKRLLEKIQFLEKAYFPEFPSVQG